MDNLKEFKAAKAELEDVVRSVLTNFCLTWGCNIHDVDIMYHVGANRVAECMEVSIKVEI